ncbi:MAG: hypothetical protein PHU25_15705 [Deltaproteobacteria bacterium]|nr:hypothetical protein [Deltaproteobacteria bacterium]
MSELPTEEECEARAEHVRELEPISRLLAKLNDPYAGSAAVSRLVDQSPILTARIVRRAMQRLGAKQSIQSINHAIMLIGNQGLEGELMTLLEDLTILKAESGS